MNRIEQVQQTHPALSDEDVSLLLCIGYKSGEDMDRWTQVLCNTPIIKHINVLSLLNDASKRSGN